MSGYWIKVSFSDIYLFAVFLYVLMVTSIFKPDEPGPNLWIWEPGTHWGPTVCPVTCEQNTEW